MKINTTTIAKGMTVWVKVPAVNSRGFMFHSGEVTSLNEDMKCVKVCHNLGMKRPRNEWFKLADVRLELPIE